MSRRYFGTDGVRGRVGQAPITPDFVMRLGYAAGRALVATEHLPAGEHPAVLIGKDTRVSGYMLESALEAGFAAAGVDTVQAKVVPTPAVAYLTRALRLQAGVVISASHNPYEDNGIKFFSARGTKLPDEVELQIESLLDEPMGCMESARLGKARRIEDAAGRYVEFCKSTFPTELDLRGLKIALDCAHGAAYSIAPKVFHELGAEVVCVGCSPNGMNINDGVGATVPGSLSEAVREHGADIGISLDGDADRLMMADATGRIYDGDELLYVIARQRMREGRLQGVVGTLMTNLALEHALNELGVGLVRAKVGDRYVLETLHQQGWRLGGENSGHIIDLDRHTTGDGIIAALQVLAALQFEKAGLDRACAGLTLYPQKLVNVKLAPGFDWKSASQIDRARHEVERELAHRGRVLLRPSGTEPLLRVMVEGQDAEEVGRLAHRLAEVVRSAMAA
ncbi:phosphoglucosamine mutase [Methyloversatilis thermotolerans]|uniref:phosphoglucosamine mutase n=1 Tax=Methyloversatilis thermotolerans TaxID=1346290 RepID=UPI000476E7EE|nr:phosphoglucosamine mutase [Methyloversatilis thermotolerans]